MRHYTFLIDILGVGQCNLKCPSCPVSNSDAKNPTGLISPDLLQEVLRKATSECIVDHVFLFNWTEPLLHPQLPEIIRIINSFRIPCYLSSNLSVKRDMEEILRACPAYFKISVSGFHQGIYGQFHKGGNIELVKENMQNLSIAHQKLQSPTTIAVAYHRYLGNLDDEKLMEKFSKDLGFNFSPFWAYYMNLDKILDYMEGNETTLTEEDKNIINKMVIPFWEGLKLMDPYKHLPCSIRENQMVLTHQAETLLCCGPYDTQAAKVANFLDVPIEEIQSIKDHHSYCKTCMKHGSHVYGVYGSNIESEVISIPALDRIGEYYAEQLGIGLDF